MLINFQGQPANPTPNPNPNSNPNQPTNRSVSQASVNNKENSIPEITETVPLLSPTPTPIPVPLESESSVGVETKARDLGKFPFHRRRSRKSMLTSTDSSVRSTASSGDISITSVNTPITKGNTSFLRDNVLRNNAHSNASLNIESASATTPAAAITDSNQDTIPEPQSDRIPPQIVHVRGVGPQTPQEPVPPQGTSKQGTIWPQGNHKWALAEAARRALTSGSVNAHKSITVNEIVMILDQNPSYTELCERLELRGFIIDRGHFARLLLGAVSSPEADSGPGPGPGANKRPEQQYAQPQMKINGFNGSMGWHGQGKINSFFFSSNSAYQCYEGIAQPGMSHPMNMTANQHHHDFGMLIKTRKFGI